MSDPLAPPRVNVEDPGAKELDESSDEHFSDASEGQASRNEATSPIPITRVERVDDEPSHGEVPGTDAYNKRTQDAVPDEVEIVPDGSRSRSASRVSANDRPFTPGGSPVPKTIVEKIDPDQPSYGDVPGTLAHSQRLADAEPDVIVKAPQPPQRKTEGSPTASPRSPMSSEDEPTLDADEPQEHQNDGAEDDDGFGDFDEFEEGGEGNDDDFGDFDDGFQQGEEPAETSFDKPPDQPPVPAPPPGPPVLNFDDLDSLDDIVAATSPYINQIYPSLQDIPSIFTTDDVRSIFSTERSKSLWTQLVAPPPLQPPDWVRSRIRRLFLVSLGVPVDLDEILPASKQKKLILPSIHVPGDKSPRPSSDALSRVKREGDDASTTSVDSSASASKPSKSRKGPAPPPELDISATTRLCATTDAALQNFTTEELERHVETLRGLTVRAKEVEGYWQGRMESAMGDKDAFEQVIESLVAHAKKLR